MAVLSLLISVFLITSNAFAGEIKISSDYFITSKTENRYELQYFYEFPYSQVYFTKQNQNFQNRYQISLQIWNQKELVAGKVLKKEILVEKYEDTKLQTKSLIDSLNLDFIYSVKNKPKLTLKVKIQDLNSDNFGEVNSELMLPEINHRILFYKNTTPNPSRIYSTDLGKDETLGIRLELSSKELKNCSLLIKKEYLSSQRRTSDKKKSRLQTEKRFFLVPTNINVPLSTEGKIMLSFSSPVRNLIAEGDGKYRINIIGYDSNNKKILSIVDFFEIKNSFFYSSTEYLEMVDRLMYIATEAEMRNLKMAETTVRESLWNDFWKKYDPNPVTEINEAEEEYFSRIDYCIKKFSSGDKGYKSDRAKIYMKYGEPDYVEYAPFERHRNAYEIWYYYRLGKQFVFADRSGFGEFILTEIK
ncbi:MAG: GWxTD domain-containing protein [candidate division WOR-3 bacterium]